MVEDRDPEDELFHMFIRDMLNEAIKNGRFPDKGNYSIPIAGGDLPIDIIPPDHDTPNAGEGQAFVKDMKPHTEIQKTGDDIIVSAELPGAKEENTAVSVEEDFVTITSLADNIRYSARIKIPPIRKETLKYSLKNGLLEVSAVGI